MAGEPVPALSAVAVTNGSAVVVASTMYSKLTSSGDITDVSVTLTAANVGDVIKVNGVTVTSGTAFTHDFKAGPTIAIVVSNAEAADPTATANYTLTVYDGVQEINVATITNIGWFGARAISGDLDSYTAGGMLIALGSFKPKYVINIMISDGFTGYFDFANKKLKVYKAPNTEATANDLSTATYSMILME